MPCSIATGLDSRAPSIAVTAKGRATIDPKDMEDLEAQLTRQKAQVTDRQTDRRERCGRAGVPFGDGARTLGEPIARRVSRHAKRSPGRPSIFGR